MAYLTEAQVTARVGGKAEMDQLTDDDGDQTPDAAVLVQVMGQLDSLLDGYARRGGYDTPLDVASADSILTPLLDIANFKLRTRGNRVASDDDRLQYENAMKILGMVGDGTWIFPTPPTSLGSAAIDSDDALFTRDLLWPL
jgi:phage gp36-like protein